MPVSVTTEQVLSLAPDADSGKAARSLATPRPWSALGRDERAVWGACQGSGKDPYKVQVDWQGGPAFKCTCPSRKFPCKHGLALLLLLASEPARFGEEPPPWVREWLAGRDEKSEKSAATKKQAAAEGAAPAKPVDEKAQAKRAADRASRVAQGLADLSLWLNDLVSHGIASAPARPYSFWDQQAARLVDAQAPGAARLVRELAGIAVSGEGWQHRMVAALGRLHLLINAYRRIDALSLASAADVRAALGFTVSQEQVLASETPVRDRWTVAGQYVEQEERLRVQRTWLCGAATGRWALLLEFAAGPAAGFKTTLMPGMTTDAELCFFPGSAPLRALVKATHGVAQGAAGGAAGPAGVPVSVAAQAFASRRAANPWIESQPATLAAVVPVHTAGSAAVWMLRDDASSAALPMRVPEAGVLFPLLAMSGGRPLAVFGEWDGEAFKPVSATAPGARVLSLRRAGVVTAA